MLFAMFVFGVGVQGGSVNYYASRTRGSDSNPGTSPEAPFLTLSKLRSVRLTSRDVKKLMASVSPLNHPSHCVCAIGNEQAMLCVI